MYKYTKMELDSRFDTVNTMSCLTLIARLKKNQNALKCKTLKVNDFQGFSSGPDGTNI